VSSLSGVRGSAPVENWFQCFPNVKVMFLVGMFVVNWGPVRRRWLMEKLRIWLSGGSTPSHPPPPPWIRHWSAVCQSVLCRERHCRHIIRLSVATLMPIVFYSYDNQSTKGLIRFGHGLGSCTGILLMSVMLLQIKFRVAWKHCTISLANRSTKLRQLDLRTHNDDIR